MQKTKSLIWRLSAVAWVVFAATAAQAQSGVQNSVTTVDELLKIENASALDKARQAAVAAGLSKPAAISGANAATPALPPATLRVESIFGIESNLRSELIYNGQRYEGVRVGTKLGRCEVIAIANRCVSLTVTDAKTPANQCPSGCWTGIPVFQPPAMAQAASSQVGLPAGIPPGGVMPSPLPMQSGPAPISK